MEVEEEEVERGCTVVEVVDEVVEEAPEDSWQDNQVVLFGTPVDSLADSSEDIRAVQADIRSDKFADSLWDNRVVPAACIREGNLADSLVDIRAVRLGILVGSLAGTPAVASAAAFAGAAWDETKNIQLDSGLKLPHSIRQLVHEELPKEFTPVFIFIVCFRPISRVFTEEMPATFDIHVHSRLDRWNRISGFLPPPANERWRPPRRCTLCGT